MLRIVMGILLSVAFIAAVSAAEETAPAAHPKCQTAEINPVTGHVLCIRPLGRAGRSAAARGQATR